MSASTPISTWTTTPYSYTTGSTSSTTVTGTALSGITISNMYYTGAANIGTYLASEGMNITISDGQIVEIKLPNGAILKTDENGGYQILEDGKVKHKGCGLLEFNKYINASDLLEEFIGHLGAIGARQRDVLDIPIEVFINWLIIRSCREDGDDIPEGIKPVEKHRALPSPHKRYRCKTCGRFISNQKGESGINFCNGAHLEIFIKRNS
jgi:hypothetical protein